MNARKLWIAAAALTFAVPAWADCGACGSGSKAKSTQHAHAHSHAHAEIGKPAPDFTLKDENGKKHTLADAKGKIVVLEWTNHQCPVVNRVHKTKVIPKTQAKFEGKPVVWWAIDSSYFCEDKLDDIKKWNKRIGIAHPVLLDAAGKVGHIYGAKTTPHMYVIDQKGVLAYNGALSDDPYGQKENAHNYVADAVSALLNGTAVARAASKPFGCSVKYKQ